MTCEREKIKQECDEYKKPSATVIKVMLLRRGICKESRTKIKPKLEKKIKEQTGVCSVSRPIITALCHSDNLSLALCMKNVSTIFLLDIVGTVYHLLIYMQSNKIHKAF